MFTAADPGFIKGGAPVYGVEICALQKLKLFAEQNILNGLDHTAFYVDYIDQELYRSIKVIIMPADYYYVDLKNGIHKITCISFARYP